MNGLHVDLFINAVRDIEISQYQILNELKRVRQNFSHNRIYPDLAHLIELHSTLTAIARNADDMRNMLGRRIKEIDVRNQRVVYEQLYRDQEDFSIIRDLIEWALPLIQSAVEEGKTMFEFVDGNLQMEVVGLLPSYLEEGYIFVPDNTEQKLYLVKYEVSIFTSADEQYRSLKTTVMEVMDQRLVLRSPHAVKMELVERYRELPNPATYQFRTELDFPFTETILPVAKRKLMRHLFS